MIYLLKSLWWSQCPSELIASFRQSINFAHAEAGHYPGLRGDFIGDPGPFLANAREWFAKMSHDEQRFIREHHHPSHYLDMRAGR